MEKCVIMENINLFNQDKLFEFDILSDLME